MKRFLRWVVAFGLAITPAAAQNVQFPAIQPGPPGQVSTWSQAGIASNLRTYTLATYGQTSTGAGDLFYMQGSATKTVRINKIVISGQATAAAFASITVSRRSATSTGGTCTSQAANIAFVDSGNVTAPTAVLNYCTAVATAGAAVNTVSTCRLAVGAIGTVSNPDVCVFSYGTNNDQPLTLRGTADWIAVAVSAFGTAGVNDFNIEFQEEP